MLPLTSVNGSGFFSLHVSLGLVGRCLFLSTAFYIQIPAICVQDIILSLVIVTICDYKLRLDLSMVKQVADATDYYIDKRCKM